MSHEKGNSWYCIQYRVILVLQVVVVLPVIPLSCMVRSGRGSRRCGALTLSDSGASCRPAYALPPVCMANRVDIQLLRQLLCTTHPPGPSGQPSPRPWLLPLARPSVPGTDTAHE